MRCSAELLRSGAPLVRDRADAEVRTIPCLQRITTQELRHVAGETCGLADENILERRQAVDETEADIAQEAEHVRAVGEQPVEPVGREAHGHGIEPTPALIA